MIATNLFSRLAFNLNHTDGILLSDTARLSNDNGIYYEPFEFCGDISVCLIRKKENAANVRIDGLLTNHY